MRTLRDEALAKTKPGEGGCLIWTGSFDQKAPVVCYGDKRGVYARANARGLIKDIYLLGRRGVQFVPICGDYRCVAEEHTLVLSHAAACRRHKPSVPLSVRLKIAKAKQARGKLKGGMESARAIRAAAAAGATHQELAEQYGIHARMVWSIVNNRAWRETTPFSVLTQGAR